MTPPLEVPRCRGINWYRRGPAPATGPADGNRPLRSDAERNRRRILRAAVFTERSLGATDLACVAWLARSTGLTGSGKIRPEGASRDQKA